MASHELRTPLTILLGLEQLALQQMIDPHPIRPLLVRMDSAGKRLQRIMDQLVKMLNAGNFDRGLDRKPADMAALLNDAADDVRPFTNLRRQTLTVDVPSDLGTMDVEASKIRDTVSHLLLNAVKFTPDGGAVTLSAKKGDAGGVEIRVADTGGGIDESCQARLFEPFFTGFDVSHHSSGHYEFGRRGMGLGLSIAHAHSSKCTGEGSVVKANQGRGSVFTIVLPASERVQASRVIIEVIAHK